MGGAIKERDLRSNSGAARGMNSFRTQCAPNTHIARPNTASDNDLKPKTDELFDSGAAVHGHLCTTRRQHSGNAQRSEGASVGIDLWGEVDGAMDNELMAAKGCCHCFEPREVEATTGQTRPDDRSGGAGAEGGMGLVHHPRLF